MSLLNKLAAAKAEVARLELEAAQATCAEVGHRWKHSGGRNCGCHETAACSVPVSWCQVCGDCDYGNNEEAAETIRRCKAKADMPLTYVQE